MKKIFSEALSWAKQHPYLTAFAVGAGATVGIGLPLVFSVAFSQALGMPVIVNITWLGAATLAAGSGGIAAGGLAVVNGGAALLERRKPAMLEMGERKSTRQVLTRAAGAGLAAGTAVAVGVGLSAVFNAATGFPGGMKFYGAPEEEAAEQFRNRPTIQAPAEERKLPAGVLMVRKSAAPRPMIG